jgi:hypothetical protein
MGLSESSGAVFLSFRVACFNYMEKSVWRSVYVFRTALGPEPGLGWVELSRVEGERGAVIS